MIGASALVALGSLLPWATATTAFGSISVDGTSGDGKITLILAGIGILCGLLFLHVDRSKSGWAGLGAVAFVLAGGVSIYHVAKLPKPTTNLAIVSVGIGLWLGTIGAVVGFVAACYALYSASQAPEFSESVITSATRERTQATVPEAVSDVLAKSPVAVAAPPLSVADELAKLAKLKAEGVLTEEEFAAQKRKLLS